MKNNKFSGSVKEKTKSLSKQKKFEVFEFQDNVKTTFILTFTFPVC